MKFRQVNSGYSSLVHWCVRCDNEPLSVISGWYTIRIIGFLDYPLPGGVFQHEYVFFDPVAYITCSKFGVNTTVSMDLYDNTFLVERFSDYGNMIGSVDKYEND